MEQKSFKLTYQGQLLHVTPSQDVNAGFFYSITFPDQEKIDIYVTPPGDGLAPNWAEGKGENTNRAKEIGELIKNYEA